MDTNANIKDQPLFSKNDIIEIIEASDEYDFSPVGYLRAAVSIPISIKRYVELANAEIPQLAIMQLSYDSSSGKEISVVDLARTLLRHYNPERSIFLASDIALAIEAKKDDEITQEINALSVIFRSNRGITPGLVLNVWATICQNFSDITMQDLEILFLPAHKDLIALDDGLELASWIDYALGGVDKQPIRLLEKLLHLFQKDSRNIDLTESRLQLFDHFSIEEVNDIARHFSSNDAQFFINTATINNFSCERAMVFLNKNGFEADEAIKLINDSEAKTWGEFKTYMIDYFGLS